MTGAGRKALEIDGKRKQYSDPEDHRIICRLPAVSHQEEQEFGRKAPEKSEKFSARNTASMKSREFPGTDLGYSGYILAGYNTLLMYIFLSGVLPVSALACLPILESLISGYITQSNIILLRLLEFSECLGTLAVMATFIYLREKK
jgi:hypothetical protein